MKMIYAFYYLIFFATIWGFVYGLLLLIPEQYWVMPVVSIYLIFRVLIPLTILQLIIPTIITLEITTLLLYKKSAFATIYRLLVRGIKQANSHIVKPIIYRISGKKAKDEEEAKKEKKKLEEYKRTMTIHTIPK